MQMILVLFTYVLLGSVTGLLSGLLGIGGGIVVVPALVFIFHHEHVPDLVVMQLAVGTSLAIMVATTLRSLIAHLSRTRHPGDLVHIAKVLLPAVFVGVFSGALTANYVHSDVLRISFGVLVLLISGRLLLFNVSSHQERSLPSTNSMRLAGVLMGALSGLLGIGGGTTVIPYLLYYQVPMRVAVAVAVSVGLLVACVGTVVYALSGLNAHGLPANTLGYIYWPAWIGTAIGSVLFAPMGARLSYFLPASLLRRGFAVLMIAVGVHMMLSA